MIKDLRIGNWLIEPGENQIVEVFKLEEDSINGLVPGCFSPIPLSEDILLKCGAKKHTNSNEFWTHWEFENGWHISQAHHSEPSAGVKEGLFYFGEEYVELEYLHDLQNFYYWYCGKKELNVNLDKQ